MTCLHQHFGKRDFSIIFTHYNDLRAFVDTFGLNAYDNLLLSLSSRGYLNSFVTEVYYTSTSATLVYTSTSTTMTTLATPSATVDSVMSTGQQGLGEHTEGPVTLKDEVFCLVLMSEDLEAS
jgi:hypothetical protein